jgi:hydroxyethylthiazole kinase-like uncharacterized protein yjeF
MRAKGRGVVRVTTAAEMHALDRLAIDTYGIPGVVLMENAGSQVVRVLCQEYPDLRARRVAVLCGRGNNGGDGFVIARYLHNLGVAVQVFVIGELDAIRGEAALHLQIMGHLGLTPQVINTPEAAQVLESRCCQCDLLIDALLGTGLKSEVSGLYRQVIAAMNAAGRPIVAVDIPSGVCADTGTLLGAHVRADLTVTLALPKRGLLLYPAADYVGKLVVVDIGFPRALRDDASLRCQLLEGHEVTAQLRGRAADTHKGSYGHVLVVAGSLGKTGAGALASVAALRAGAGLVTFAVPHSLNRAMEAKLTEVMTIPLPEVEEGVLGADAAKRIIEQTEGMSALVIGPGLGMHPETVHSLHNILRQIHLPTVVDADALNALAAYPSSLDAIHAPLILTPHPGELARLRHTTTGQIQADRLTAARETAQAYRAVVVLKGAHTVIAEPEGMLTINPTGNPGMATAGTGDVLSGMIGAFLGQEYAPGLAARLAVYVHGFAGDMAAATLGQRSMTAGDLLDFLPRAFQEVELHRDASAVNWEHRWVKRGARISSPITVT